MTTSGTLSSTDVAPVASGASRPRSADTIDGTHREPAADTSAKLRPSGDHRGASPRPPLFRVSCTGSPPALAHTQISSCPDLVEISAICRPSGEYCGQMSSRVELRNCSGIAVLVSRSSRMTLESGDRRSNTNRFAV